MNITDIILLLYGITLLYILYLLKNPTTMEHFGSTIDFNAIKNLSQAAVNLQRGGLTVPGNLTVSGKLTVRGGSSFSGNEHWFQDRHSGGAWLRVGGAWGNPGIYAGSGRYLSIGGSGGQVHIPQHLKVNHDIHSDRHFNRETHSTQMFFGVPSNKYVMRSWGTGAQGQGAWLVQHGHQHVSFVNAGGRNL